MNILGAQINGNKCLPHLTVTDGISKIQSYTFNLYIIICEQPRIQFEKNSSENSRIWHLKIIFFGAMLLHEQHVALIYAQYNIMKNQRWKLKRLVLVAMVE